ncbi:hypothetical protein SKAU_G00339250 [Synaphobranchus kaupii]|uniref:Uncharacterized protein n=1 Tax=Synaphobranchus kaupii TaxID=118154 RepID=A0A9Q1EMR6_SYNKA|nr:hypothetical protein SKAU_G00339250 [Synaphobranchus kaupii]
MQAQMLKPVAATKNGLHRYKAQEHKGLIRSLELECRYCQMGRQQQQRQYHSSLGRLSMARSSFSIGLGPAQWLCTTKALKSIQTGCGGTEGTEALQATSVGSTEEPDPCSLENSLSTESAGESSWSTLSFTDIRHRHRVMIQTQEPFRKWQHLLLFPSEQPPPEYLQGGAYPGQEDSYGPQITCSDCSRVLRSASSHGRAQGFKQCLGQAQSRYNSATEKRGKSGVDIPGERGATVSCREKRRSSRLNQ